MLLSTDEICKVCFEFPGDKLIQTECGCSACFDCHQGWIRSQLEEGRSVELRCPMPDCKYIFSDAQARALLNPQNRELYERVETLIYLRESTDMRMCPMQKCEYAGFKAKGQYEFYCPNCNSCWEEKRTTVASSIKNFRNALNEVTSVVWKGAFCKYCPGCSVPIEKNAGCPHMTCWTCGHQFCWKCMDNWLGHEPSKCETNISSEICLGAFICMLLRMYFLADTVYWFINTLTYYLGYPLLGTMYAVLLFYIFSYFRNKLSTPFREYEKTTLGSLVLSAGLIYKVNYYLQMYSYTCICVYIAVGLLATSSALSVCKRVISYIRRWRIGN